MKIDCVILAAGLSSRMGANKMMLEIGGKTIIERSVHSFYEICSEIFVVTGRYHEDIKKCLSAYPKAHIIYNCNYRQGMFGSVKAGVDNIRAERFFITPGDYPLLKTETIYQMASVSGCFIAPVYKGVQGHPILLGKLFVPIILNSTCISLRDCLEGASITRRELYVDDRGVVTDIDTVEEYKVILER